MGKLINKQDTIDKIKKETLINYSVAVMAEVAERAKQEDAPIYEGDKEVASIRKKFPAEKCTTRQWSIPGK